MDTSEYRGRRLLATLQLADSFFPTGAYAHSQGLEQMVAQGWVSNSAQVEEYLTEQLTGAVLPSDGVALLNACEAAAGGDGETIIAIDRLLHAMKLPEEVRLASTQSGRRLLDESLGLLAAGAVPLVFEEYRRAVLQREVPGSAAVAFAVSACAMGIPAETGPALLLPQICRGDAGSGPAPAAPVPFRGPANSALAARLYSFRVRRNPGKALARHDSFYTPC